MGQWGSEAHNPPQPVVRSLGRFSIARVLAMTILVDPPAPDDQWAMVKRYPWVSGRSVRRIGTAQWGPRSPVIRYS
jgi:hypothetical protein